MRVDAMTVDAINASSPETVAVCAMLASEAIAGREHADIELIRQTLAMVRQYLSARENLADLANTLTNKVGYGSKRPIRVSEN